MSLTRGRLRPLRRLIGTTPSPRMRSSAWSTWIGSSEFSCLIDEDVDLLRADLSSS